MRTFILINVLLLTTCLYSTIINIPGDQPTIQAGIDATVDSDTVLVQPGTYIENINYNGKNITVASLFLTTQDTAYIFQTIIDGNQSGSVVTCASEEYATNLCGFTITNGSAFSGGGIYCSGSNMILQFSTVMLNTSHKGGGIMSDWDSYIRLENVIVKNNSALFGGGIYCGEWSSTILFNVTVTANSASNHGGGIYYFGEYANLSFNSSNRSNIYANTIENSRGSGSDIFYYECYWAPEIKHIIVDTFTVMTPTDYYASPIDKFTFDILHCVEDGMINSDVYVSVDGDDSNNGLNPELPFKTITHALKKIYTDSLNIHAIHLAGGIYSPSTNGEIFPLRWNNYTNLIGVDQETTILDANYTSGVLNFLWITEANISNVTIRNGNAEYGGGINCEESEISLENMVITGNSADAGGGICCYNSNPGMINVIIEDNSANWAGGGIYSISLYPISQNLNISDKVDYKISESLFQCPYLENVTITNNLANIGGGIYCEDSNLNFDPVNRCNIYLNFASSGCDLYSGIDYETINIIVDTFTVLQPDDYFVHPIDNFTFDILNAKIEQVNQDLYVSPNGSNTNSGLTAADPLLSITHALTIIAPDSLENNSIHLSKGTYSPSETGEIFPLNCRSYVSLLGEDETTTILDGEGLSGILFSDNENDFSIENMTVKNGNANNGGGMSCVNSNPSLKNLTITGNSASKGGGIRCSNSNPSLIDVTITGNSASQGGGMYCFLHSNPSLQNVTITGNYAVGGCGIYCYNSSPNLVNVSITDNTASDKGGGLYCNNSSYPNLENVTITGNFAENYGSGIYSRLFSNPNLINSIVWNNTPQEINGSVTVTYSDIAGGWTGTGNINEDPLFVDLLSGDYHLTENSPCIDAGDPTFPLDPDGTISDMGAYYFHQTAPLDPPQNVTIIITGADVHLSWDAVAGASSYKVYSSNEPYTGFVEDTSGSFVGESWSTSIINEKKFYYVISSTEIIRFKRSD